MQLDLRSVCYTSQIIIRILIFFSKVILHKICNKCGMIAMNIFKIQETKERESSENSF